MDKINVKGDYVKCSQKQTGDNNVQIMQGCTGSQISTKDDTTTISNTDKSTVIIDGKKFITPAGKFQIINGVAYIGDTPLNPNDTGKSVNIHISIMGNCGDIQTTGIVEVGKNCQDINAKGDIVVYGNVEGNIKSKGNVTVHNGITGRVKASGNIIYKK